MNKFLTLYALLVLAVSVKAQTPSKSALTEEYGKVSKEELELTSCDFEKDANAEVLFDKAKEYYDSGESIFIERHLRIKVFNEFGKSAASISISYGNSSTLSLNDIEGETINIENGKQVITPLDKKLIYTEKTDKSHITLKFALPNVKAGSVFEFKYKWHIGYYPNWYFQSHLPTRYSEISTVLPHLSDKANIRLVPHVKQPFVKDIGAADDPLQTKALANVHSLPDEQYMGAREDNLQRMEFLYRLVLAESWKKIGELLVKANDVGLQFDESLKNEKDIIKQAKSLKTDDEKIAFIFDKVRNDMKWNDISTFYTTDGVASAWDKKIGNSAEINFIVYHLLKKTGVTAYPMIVSTKKNGRINPANPDLGLFNKAVVYIPIDSAKCYVLDATNKYNIYNTVPEEDLNTFGLNIDKDEEEYKPVFIENNTPSIQSVFLNAEIKPDGKMSGSAEIASSGYNKTKALSKYKKDGEEKFLTYLRNNDNNLKVSSLKLEDTDDDNLPLTQKFNFNADLQGSDGNYIYFNTNLFTLMGANPFTNEDRFSDIDFGYKDNYSINGIYKLPAGYKTATLPKNVTIVIPDGSISFKRQIIEEDGIITVRYVLSHKKTIYFFQDYQNLRGFYKQLYELLNEQIVLKKA